MNKPDLRVYDNLALESKAARRAFEHFHVRLTWGDLWEIVEKIKNDQAVFVGLTEPAFPDDPKAEIWVASHKGVVMPFLIVDVERQGLITATCWPYRHLDDYMTPEVATALQGKFGLTLP